MNLPISKLVSRNCLNSQLKPCDFSDLNQAVQSAEEPYLAFDGSGQGSPDKGWLPKSVGLLEAARGVGAVVSTPFFQFRHIDEDLLRNGSIDIRFRRTDIPHFGKIENVEVLAGRPMVFRRDCFEALGGFDPDMERFYDIDLLLRIRRSGWRVVCVLESRAPGAALPVVRLECQDQTSEKRCRLFYVAKSFPQLLPSYLEGDLSFFDGGDPAAAYRNTLLLLTKAIQANEPEAVADPLGAICRRLAQRFGERRVDRFLSDMERALGYRKLSFGIYDHALQTPGGGQKYACTIASVLQDDYDVTFIANKPVTTTNLEEWYGLDLGRCQLKVVKIPFYEKKGCEFIDQGMVTGPENAFDLIAEESARYDLFMNVNMLTKVKPRSLVSIFLCHFPDSKRTRHFAVDDYTYLVANSRYTIEWLKKRWRLSPSVHIYPPVDMVAKPKAKDRLILSVARFDATGFKRQEELVDAFDKLIRQAPRQATGWRLILAGGSYGRNPYLRKLKRKVGVRPDLELLENLPLVELRELYARAAIFWHACGLNTDVPERIEHFGMATVEAMQNGCVPVVINKGGQKEIVEHGVSGFLFNDIAQLCGWTIQLMDDPDLLKRFSQNAFERGTSFSRERFDESIRSFFKTINEKHFANVWARRNGF